MKKFVKRFLCMVLVLVMVLSVAVTASAAGGNGFSDVPSTKWSYKAVMNAREKGYVNGVGGNRFDPYGKLTYAQLSQVVYNMAGRPRYLCCYTDGDHTYENGYYNHPSVVGEIKTLADYDEWSAWFKDVYPDDGRFGHQTETFYIDLQAPDCIEQCKEHHLNTALNNNCTKYSYDYLSYNSKGKWFTSAFVWAHQMGLIPNNKTAYDLATREDVVKALHGLYEWTSEYFYGGEWVYAEYQTEKLNTEWNGVLPGSKLRAFKVEDGKVYKYEKDSHRYDYLKEEYDVLDTDSSDYSVYGWAIENHIIAGNGTYTLSGKKDLNVGANVTREEFAQFLYNYDRYAA